jgi:diketogulonate reductase-like aldo/keto reductase
VAERHGASPARVALAWTLSRDNISSVLIAARKLEHLEDNIKAVDLELAEEDINLLDDISDPGIPYPRWMVLQQAYAEDPRAKAIEPGKFVDGGPWEDLRFKKMPLEE